MGKDARFENQLRLDTTVQEKKNILWINEVYISSQNTIILTSRKALIFPYKV